MRVSKISFCSLLSLWLLFAPVIASPTVIARAAAREPNFQNDQSQKHSQTEQCLPYEPAAVNLKGRISRGTFTNANNKKETVWLLNLDSSVCVKGVAGDEIDVDADNIKRIQLVLTAEMYQKYKKFVGQKVGVSGTLYHGHTAHHFTDVLLTITAVK